MKILCFEYLCAGGMRTHNLPATFAREGAMMLQALLDNLKHLPGVQAAVAIHPDYLPLLDISGVRLLKLDQHSIFLASLPLVIADFDYIWPIAPETGGILSAIAERIGQAGKTAILSSPETLRICSDKMQTFKHLQQAGLPHIASYELGDAGFSSFPRVIKPKDGAGCQDCRIVYNEPEYRQFCAALADPRQFLEQPFVAGETLSLSAFFKQGKAWLICCNRQMLKVDHGFHLQACQVNINNDKQQRHQFLIDGIAKALPGLFGYIGIDIIDSPRQTVIVEINPRLTSSFIGIRQATGVNVGEQVIKLLTNEPVLGMPAQHTVEVRLN